MTRWFGADARAHAEMCHNLTDEQRSRLPLRWWERVLMVLHPQKEKP